MLRYSADRRINRTRQCTENVAPAHDRDDKREGICKCPPVPRQAGQNYQGQQHHTGDDDGERIIPA